MDCFYLISNWSCNSVQKNGKLYNPITNNRQVSNCWYNFFQNQQKVQKITLFGPEKIRDTKQCLFSSWPLVHIALSTTYQLVTQIVLSHWKDYQVWKISQISLLRNPIIKIPSLYSAWATTVSVGIHLALHSLSIFWKISWFLILILVCSVFF